MGRVLRLATLVLAASLLGTTIASTSVAQVEGSAARRPRPVVRAIRTDDAPEIDGRLDEAAWKRAGVIDALQQKVPVAWGEASQRTETRVLYDSRFLYIGVRAWDAEPDRIVARKMVRDGDMVGDDRITISLDTFASERNGFQFEINPLANKRDGLIENGQVAYEWDGIWYAGAEIDDEGYIVEVAIPYQTLSISNELTHWGMQIVRFTRRNGEEDRWATPTPEIEPFNMKGNGRLEGLEGLEQGLGLDVIPKFAVRYRDDGISGRTKTDIEPGLDAFYRITPGLTGALTVNTDFGEAEVDTRQINLTRFNLFFPEKRQFFLQDAGIFNFGGLQRNPLPFFSRRIGLSNQGEEIPILAGAKVTGRVGRINVGLLDVVTDGYTRLPTGDDEPVRVKTKNLAVARMSANVLQESTVGMVFTAGDPNSNQDNFLVGADFNYRNSNFRNWGRTLIARAWAQRTFTEGIDSKEFAWGTRLAYPNDRINWYLIAEGVQKNFFPALGFTSRRGINNYYAGYRFRHRPEKYLRTLDHRITGSYITGTGGGFQSAELSLEPLILENAAGDRANFLYSRVFERLNDPFQIRSNVAIPGGDYEWDRFTVDLKAGDSRLLSAGFVVSWGGFFGGRRLDIRPNLSWRPSRYLQLTASYSYNDIDLPGGDFDVHLASLKADIQFSPWISWNTFLQYDSDSDSVGIQTRLRWIVDPGREIFLILNQGLLFEDGNVRRGETEPRAKIGWTLRF